MEKIKAYMPLLGFLILPFGFISLGLIHIGHYYAFSILGLIIAASMIRKGFVSMFLVYLAVWQVHLFLVVMGTPKLGMAAAAAGYNQMIFFLIGAVIYIAMAKSTVNENAFFNVICIAAILQCLLGFVQWFKFDPVMWFISQFVSTRANLPDAVVGSLGNPNFLAAFLAISLPFFFRKWWKWALILVVPVLLGSMTSSAVDPAIFGVYAFWFLSSDFNDPVRTFKRAVFGFIAACALSAFYSFVVDASLIDNPRFGYWNQAGGQASSSFWSIIFGCGPGAGWGQKWPLHSEWVTCFFQFGVLGVSLLIGYILTVGRVVRHPALLASFVVIMLNFIGNSALHYAPTAFLICMIGGLIEREEVTELPRGVD